MFCAVSSVNFCVLYIMLAMVCAMSSDKSIPQLGATMTEYQAEINQLSSLVISQVEFEQAAHENRAQNAQHALPCKEPRYLAG